MQPLNTMQVGDLLFDVEKAELTALLLEGALEWCLEVWSSQRPDVDGPAPYAYTHALDSLLNKRVERWQDILRTDLAWNEPYNRRLDRLNAGLYYYSHEGMPDGRVRFSTTRSRQFDVHWEGHADISAIEFEQFDEIPFLCNATVAFVGAKARGLSRALASSTIAEYISDQPFSFSRVLNDGCLLFEPED